MGGVWSVFQTVSRKMLPYLETNGFVSAHDYTSDTVWCKEEIYRGGENEELN